MSLTQRKSEFEKWIRAYRPAIEKAALGFLSCGNCRTYVFILEQLVRHVYPYYYDEFDDRILRILDAKFCHLVAHVYSQTSNLASFTVEIATKF